MPRTSSLRSPVVSPPADADLPPRPLRECGPCSRLESDFFVAPPPYHVLRRRGTTTALVFYTRSGEGFFRSSEGGVHRSAPGELVIYEPNVEQEYGTPLVAGLEWRFHWVHVFPRTHWLGWLRLDAVPRIPGLWRTSIEDRAARAALEPLWQRLHTEVRGGSPWWRELAMNTVERILLVAWEARAAAAPRPLDERVQSVLEIVTREPHCGRSVPALARQVGLSPSRLAHLFRAETGSSIMEVSRRALMAEAERLLERTRLDLAEIAHKLGFSSPQHFSSQFSVRHGMSPRAYRARSQGGETAPTGAKPKAR